uniref:Uncharacterized protein n=1 Tax=Tanacetum cinerariifolium TaxID=118510 RepID=A0A699HBG3_TANCI|nr:hypothetical protein [Tanacetum cinerariifolium]
MKLKLLRSLPSERKTHALIWRNKADIETINLDDLYNNLKIYEPKLTGSLSISQNPKNVAFVSINSTNSTSCTNEADNTAFRVCTAHSQGNTVNFTFVDNLSDAVICAFLSSQPNSPQLIREVLEQISPNNLEEMDLHWAMVMLTIRARRVIKTTCRNLDINGKKIGFDSDVKTIESKHKSVDVKNKGMYNTVETKHVRKNSFSPPIIEDWNSDNESKGNPRQKEYKENGVIDSGSSRHMTRNKYYLTDYKDYDVSPTIYTSGIRQFWTSAKVKNVNDDVRLQALVNGKKVIVNEASIRRDL